MRTSVSNRLAPLGALGAALALGIAAWAPGAASALAGPARAAIVTPSSACTSSGGTATCDLWARTGTLTLPAGATPSACESSGMIRSWLSSR